MINSINLTHYYLISSLRIEMEGEEILVMKFKSGTRMWIGKKNNESVLEKSVAWSGNEYTKSSTWKMKVKTAGEKMI